MMASALKSDVLAMCLKNPQDAPTIVKSMKTDILLKSNFDASASNYPSVELVATIVETISWCWLWDIPLDHGSQGMCGLQTLQKRAVTEHLKASPVDCVCLFA